ncbi:MAG: hypothetical protein V4604_05700 [Bacteroidota bacterium]
MKKKTSVILVLISLVVMSVAYYLFRFVVRDRSFESTALAILFTLMAVMVLYVAYRELLKRLGRGATVKEDYAVLFGLEKPQITGEVEFYFTINQPKHIIFTILDQQMKPLQTVTDQDYQSGGHILRFNTESLTNGLYFYCLESENQKTMKRMFIQHDKMTV